MCVCVCVSALTATVDTSQVHSKEGHTGRVRSVPLGPSVAELIVRFDECEATFLKHYSSKCQQVCHSSITTP